MFAYAKNRNNINYKKPQPRIQPSQQPNFNNTNNNQLNVKKNQWTMNSFIYNNNKILIRKCKEYLIYICIINVII